MDGVDGQNATYNVCNKRHEIEGWIISATTLRLPH